MAAFNTSLPTKPLPFINSCGFVDLGFFWVSAVAAVKVGNVGFAGLVSWRFWPLSSGPAHNANVISNYCKFSPLTFYALIYFIVHFHCTFCAKPPLFQVSIGISISFHWPLVRCKSCIILIVVQFYCCVNNLPSLPATNKQPFWPRQKRISAISRRLWLRRQVHKWSIEWAFDWATPFSTSPGRRWRSY